MQKVKGLFKAIEQLFLFAIEQRLAYQNEVNKIRAVAGDSLRGKTDVEIVEAALRQYALLHAHGISSDENLNRLVRNSLDAGNGLRS